MDLLLLVDKLALNLERFPSLFLYDTSNNLMCGFNSIEVTGEVGTFVASWLEVIVGELFLALFPNFL
jgi:hypothetical protein